MIQFEQFSLDNGLQVVVHTDPNSRVAAVNILYHVGARDEHPALTGLAHLCEHLMFSESKHIPAYDMPLQSVGGTNNAYTSSDITNYYCTLPATNLETAFWLESDRMLAPAANEMALEIQKKVVIEEFKEVYLNQPYGDAWGELSKLAYTLHPYQWPVIGKDIGHLEKVTLGDVQAFFRQFYVPNNAVLVVAGAVEPNDVRQLAQKWFGPIPAGPASNKKFIGEPTHQGPRRATLERPVPLDAIYKAYPTPAYGTPSHDAIQLGCVALGTGKSSRLYQQLVEGKKYFNTIEAHTTDTLDPGLLVITGRINPDVPIALADEALSNLIDTLRQEGLTDDELAKAQHRLEADFFYDNIEIEQRAEALAIGTLLGDTNWINTNLAQLAAISLKAVDTALAEALQPSCSATLYYQKKL